MAWTNIAPTCNQSVKRAGIMPIAADAVAYAIPVCAPHPPYPYFLHANWNTGYSDAEADESFIAGLFSTPAPSDGSGMLSWAWDNP